MKVEKKSDGKYGGVGGQGTVSGSHKNTFIQTKENVLKYSWEQQVRCAQKQQSGMSEKTMVKLST